jgi:hypothetical protein
MSDADDLKVEDISSESLIDEQGVVAAPATPNLSALDRWRLRKQQEQQQTNSEQHNTAIEEEQHILDQRALERQQRREKLDILLAVKSPTAIPTRTMVKIICFSSIYIIKS